MPSPSLTFTDTSLGLDWSEIATRANRACNLDPDHELTGPACYSRFKRNAPLVAETKGEPYQKEWYLHMSGRVTFAKQATEDVQDDETEDEEEVDENRALSTETEAEIVRTVEHEKAQFWTNVTEVLNAKFDGEVLSEADVRAVYYRLVGSSNQA
jgi:hypothetical protein